MYDNMDQNMFLKIIFYISLLMDNIINMAFCAGSIFAKLSSSSVLVQSNLNWDLHYNHCKSHPPTQPPTPGKYIWASSKLPRKLKFGMEPLLNQTRSTS